MAGSDSVREDMRLTRARLWMPARMPRQRPTAVLMRRIRYTKYVPDPAGEMSMEDLLSALSDYLLQSGFQNYMFYDLPPGEQTLDDLRHAIDQALLDGNLLDEEMRQRKQMQMDGTLDE